MTVARPVALAVLMLVASAAQAQAAELSMKVKPTKVKQGGSVAMTLTGQADGPSDVQVYRRINGRSCAPTSAGENDRRKSRYVGGTSVDFEAGPAFTLKLRIRLAADGPYAICAYLGSSVEGPPDATAKRLVRAVKK